MTQDEVKALFVYEPLTGLLRRVGGRKTYPWHGTGKSEVSGNHYRQKNLLPAQLVWLYHHGAIPPMLDHINRDPRDCKSKIFESVITDSIQHCQAEAQHIRAAKVWAKCPRKPWQAKTVIRGRVKSLGYFPTKELAAVAYAKGRSFNKSLPAHSEVTLCHLNIGTVRFITGLRGNFAP
jgi:hypothetical protein